jgi:hypothetical protein
MGIVKGYFKNQYERIKAPLKEARSTSKSLQTGIRSVVKSLRNNRDPKAEGAPDLENFNAVLSHWDIEPHQVPKVIWGLKIRTASYGVIGLVGTIIFIAAATTQKFILFVSGIVLMVLAITALFTGAWRIHVLKNRRFVPFKQWVRALFFG